MVRSPAADAKQREAAQARIFKGPVDMIHLAKQTLGDRGLEEEVLRLFDQTARAYFGRIEHSTSADELLFHLHTLKGAAAGVGARAIADLARTAEEDLRAGKAVDPERIEDLHMAVTECSEWIERVLPKDQY